MQDGHMKKDDNLKQKLELYYDLYLYITSLQNY